MDGDRSTILNKTLKSQKIHMPMWPRFVEDYSISSLKLLIVVLVHDGHEGKGLQMHLSRKNCQKQVMVRFLFNNLLDFFFLE